MSKSTKVCLITATVLVLIGAIIFIGVMYMLKFDFLKLGTDKYETNTYQITEAFEKISVDVDTAEIKFLPSDDDQCKVVCYEEENRKHSVIVKDSTLNITVNDTRKWYEHIGIFVSSPKLTVYLPQDKYASLSIDTATGSVTIPEEFTFDDIKINGSTGAVECSASVTNLMKIDLSTGKINLDSLTANNITLTCTTGSVNINSVNAKGNVSANTSTGGIKIANLNCADLNAKTTTGGVNLSNTIATNNFVINTTTGGVKFDYSDATNINVNTTTGGVTGTLLSDKVFITDTTTGSVKVPRTTTGGVCEISTTTGSIKIDIQ